MLANFGFGSVAIAFAISLYGVAAAFYGARKNQPAWVQSARLAQLLTFPLLTIAAISIIYLLVTNQYQVQYVYNTTSNTMPMYLKVTALWGGQAGSLLFWSWLMAAFASAVTLRKWSRDHEFLPWVIVVTLVTLAFFLALVLFVENPFVRFWQTSSGRQISALFQPAGSIPLTPTDGRGLNPLLRHFGMIIHPPLLYLGFVAYVIPFAFAISTLVTGRSDDRWIRITRRWTLAAWLFLSLGLVLGSRWAYDVLGWGGYWGWDPVEIAALMPWLTGTPFLHSVMIQEKRGLFKRWNIILILLTYSLVIIGTFLTRSGVLSSVHAFAQSAIGPLFLVFVTFTLAISLALLLYRWNDLRSEGHMQSLLSRESLFLFNNLLFIGVLIVCFWGVFYPLISELVNNEKMTVGPVFYERATGPLFAGLLLLMGIAPLSAWGHSTFKTIGRAAWKPLVVSLIGLVLMLAGGIRNISALIGLWVASFALLITLYEFWRGVRARMARMGENPLTALLRLVERNRRRYGGYIIHFGVIFMAVGIIGIELFQTETQGTLRQGESLTLRNYTVTYQSLAQFDYHDGRNVARAVLTVERNGQLLGELYPRRDYYYDSQQAMTIPGVRSTIEDDIYVLLVDWEPVTIQSATFRIYHNPLINWFWIGGFVFVLGTLAAAWPDREPEPARARAAAPVTVKRSEIR